LDQALLSKYSEDEGGRAGAGNAYKLGPKQLQLEFGCTVAAGHLPAAYRQVTRISKQLII
jgi:hypothetical protein